jgi:putative Ca2+/H+ antiporter (TMEM165/GDT1 family)
MDRALFISTFITVFVAELGDKTQLATFSLTAGGASRWTVFLASASALVCSTALAVVAGEAIGRVIPPVWLKRAGGTLLVVMGAWMVWSASAEDAAPPAAPPASPPVA